MQYLGLTAFNDLGHVFVNDRQVDIAVMGISFGYVYIVTIGYGVQYLGPVSYTHLDVYKRQTMV